jgi:hypothetical protein
MHIIRVIKSWRMKWLGHVAQTGVEKFTQNFGLRDHLGDLGIDGKIGTSGKPL